MTRFKIPTIYTASGRLTKYGFSLAWARMQRANGKPRNVRHFEKAFALYRKS